jgi:inositol-hexakisphosphate 5-kinase
LFKVYQTDSDRYKFTDKYRGRALNVDGFRSALVQYFDNGQCQRIDVLPELIARLESLYIKIDSLAKYRFYSGSLLIVYDGSLQSNLTDVRMIDFAHTTCSAMPDDESSNYSSLGPDQGYLYGLRFLIGLLKEIFDNGKQTLIDNIDE